MVSMQDWLHGGEKPELYSMIIGGRGVVREGLVLNGLFCPQTGRWRDAETKTGEIKTIIL